MRIAYLSTSNIPSRAANGVHVMKMCHSFASHGHDVVLVASQADAAEQIDDAFGFYGVSESFEIVKVRRRRVRFVGFWLYSRAVKRKLAERQRPHVLYSRDRLSALLTADMGIPFLFEAHEAPTGMKQSIEKRLFRNQHFARLVVISQRLRDEYLARFQELTPEKILVAPDGADLPSQSQPAVLPPTEDGSRLRVGYVGHLYPGRGVEIILALARRMTDVDFHVVGGYDDDIARWRNESQDLQNVIFHGFVTPSAADAYRQAVDVLIAPYQRNVFTRSGADIAEWFSPLKLFEYMAARKPIVVSDLPVLREVLEPDVTALIVPPDDIDAWEQAVSKLRDPERRARMGAAAGDRFENEYTWEKRAGRILRDLPQLPS